MLIPLSHVRQTDVFNFVTHTHSVSDPVLNIFIDSCFRHYIAEIRRNCAYYMLSVLVIFQFLQTPLLEWNEFSLFCRGSEKKHLSEVTSVPQPHQQDDVSDVLAVKQRHFSFLAKKELRTRKLFASCGRLH